MVSLSNQERGCKTFWAKPRIPYFDLKEGRLIYRQWPQVPPYEKGIDVKIATDMVVHSFRGTCDTLVLVSGDTDFVDAIQAVKDNGKHVEVALFGGTRSSQALRDVADRIIEIDAAFLANCWLQKRTRG